MSAYTEKIETHRVYTDLQNVQDELEIISKIEEKAPVEVEALARIASIIKRFSVTLDNCDKEYIAMAWLDETATALTNIKNHLNTYKTTKDSNYLTNQSFTQLNTVLFNIAKINSVNHEKNEVITVLESTEEYRKVLENYNRQLYEKVKSLSEEITNLRGIIAEDKKQTEKDLNNFKNTINTERQRLDSFATKYQDQMAADQKSFSELEGSLKDAFNTAQEERKNVFDSTIGIFKADSVNLIENYGKKFSDYEHQVENIVGVVNTNMFSHRYKQVADDAKERSKNWHRLAVFLMAVGAGFAIYTFVVSLSDDITWIKFIAKIFATITIASGAVYAARQATKQEKVERYARKIEMELVAIDPFIQSLEKEKQSEIKEEIAKKIFGNSDEMGFSEKEEQENNTEQLILIDGILKSIAGFVGKN